ncbi:carbohydrate sulfotransferase 15-like isoform X2 [Thalassophryne amazonica]|uniref:carbohydrate sulfotransferase 15-like isoform X2 n=1 Tax=Thalassophryne amazonica TaxID=390379 RepID=UPI001471964E|nr:carbohydrate sulfotransferase 15-like isoform X2 [Thalassophryne amazonica]
MCPGVNMPQSDCKYVNNNHHYSLHSVPTTGINGKKPIITFFDFKHKNGPEHLEIHWVSLLSFGNLRSISKVKVVSFLLGLTLTFFIMASYILTWDRKGFLVAPDMDVSTGTIAVSSVCLGKSSIDIDLLAGLIGSKLKYTARKVPNEKDVIGTEPHLFSVIPRQFLPGIKSPCWHEEVSSKLAADPYRGNRFTLRSKSFQAVCGYLSTTFQKSVYLKDGKQLRLRCLPYFYIIGQPKCGTTDLFHRLLLHPDIKFNTVKEPHWWTRKRFGYIRFKDGLQEGFPVNDYLDLFDLAAHKIQEGMVGNSSGDHHALQLITGEASASTMWDNQAWSYLHGDREETDPPFLAQDFIHVVHPGAKIIIMLRDPVERLYSDYLYFKMANKSAEDFHQKVSESVQLFESCLFERPIRSCVYNTSLSNAMPVRLNLGMYIVFLLDWLTVFHREQILVLRLEDYAANLKETIRKVFDFLSDLCQNRKRRH